MTIRTAIAHYTLVEPLGEGGMGVVWKARDTHLDRFVAIKLLPHEIVDSSRFSRLVHEAKAASALNHPNIVHIYDAAECDGTSYIAMEYVPGNTLEEIIGRRGMRLSDVLKYGAQIADGMAAAHSAGIVHRDLKPSNIVVAENGTAKVLDFGLAKLLESRAVVDATTETGTVPVLSWSANGKVAGTVPYLSPEQAEGLPVDVRCDIFAFGIVLYEMLSGVNPFRRETRDATISSILHDEPKRLRELVPAVPSDFERLVTRCLRKNPERRLRSMADLAVALRELKEECDSGQLATPSVAQQTIGHGRALAWVFVALGVIALLVAASAWWILGGPSRDVTLKVVPITTYAGWEVEPSLAPDGSQLAFAWNGASEQKLHIYLKAIGSGPPLQLTKDNAEDRAPAWSPDGASIAFLRVRAGGHFSVMLIPALGGPERKLADIYIPEIDWMPGPYLSWMPDSRSLVFPDHADDGKPTALFSVVLQTGARRQVTVPPAGTLGDACAALSPDGHTLAFCRCLHMGAWHTDLYAVALGTSAEPVGDARQLMNEHLSRVTGLTWNPNGKELIFGTVFKSDTLSLWRLAVSGASTHSAVPLPVGPGSWPTAARRSSRLVFSRQLGGGPSIWRLPLSSGSKAAGRAAPLIVSTRADFAPRYSPDGKRIAFESSRGGNLEIWTCNSAGQECLPLTAIGSAFTGLPSWSPDGKQIAFYSRTQDKSQIFVIGADGSGLRQLTAGDSNHFMPRWSRDGKWIYFSLSSSGTSQIWKITPDGSKSIQVTQHGGFASLESWNGKWLYYTKSEAADASLWRTSTSGGIEIEVLPTVHLHNFEIGRDGVYFLENASMLKFRNNAGQIITAATQLPPGYVGLSLSPDKKAILFTVSKPQETELALVENLD